MDPFAIQLPRRHLQMRKSFFEEFEQLEKEFDQIMKDFDETRPQAKPLYAQKFEQYYDGRTGQKKDVETRQIGEKWVRKTIESDINGTVKEHSEYHNIGKEDVSSFEKEWEEYLSPSKALPSPEEEFKNSTEVEPMNTTDIVQTMVPPAQVNISIIPKESPQRSEKKTIEASTD